MIDKNNTKRILFTVLIISTVISGSLLTGCVAKRESLLFDGEKRTYIIDLPVMYDSTVKYPLVLVFHGGGGNADHIREVTQFSQHAEEEGFIVVYPDGSGRFDRRFLTWNCGFCCGYALENNVDDIGFIRALIQYLTDEYSINESRIYATGFSNGGIMSYYAGAELSDVIAAIAPVAAQIGGQASEQEKIWRIPKPDEPVSVLSINGMNDSRVPYDGGRPKDNDTAVYSWMSTNESISFWVNANQCNSFPQRNISDSGNIITDTYAGGINNTMVRLISIVNGTHMWPGSHVNTQENSVMQELDATEVIWKYFDQHPKR